MGQSKRFDPEERLDRAVAAFWESGFDGIGMQALCRAMELFPGSVYATYGDKRHLFLRAIDRYLETCSAEALGLLGAASGRGSIHAYFEDRVEAILSGRRRWGCLVTNAIVELAGRDPEVRARTDAHLNRLTEAFATAITRGQAAGEIPAELPAAHAGFLVCVVQGLNVLAKTDPSRAALEDIAAAALASLGK